MFLSGMVECALETAKKAAHPIPQRFLKEPLPILKVSHCILQDKRERMRAHIEEIFPSGDIARTRLEEALHNAFPEFGAGASLPAIYSQLLAWREVVAERFAPHLLDFVEYYAGEGHLTDGMLTEGYKGKCFDISYAETACGQDLLTAEGFRAATLATMFLRTHDGESWHGLVCSSWVFLSRSSTKRKAVEHHIWGDHAAAALMLQHCLMQVPCAEQCRD